MSMDCVDLRKIFGKNGSGRLLMNRPARRIPFAELSRHVSKKMYPILHFMFGPGGISRRQDPDFVAAAFELYGLVIDNPLRTTLRIAEVCNTDQEHSHRMFQLTLRTFARTERNLPP